MDDKEVVDLKIIRFEPNDVRLGRHVVHDARSRRYAVRAADPATLRSVRHEINIPILDQGNVGSCTGHAAVANMGYEKFWATAQEFIQPNEENAQQFAVTIYSEATRLDPWPGQYLPEDTGSDGLSVAKALHQRDMIAGYQHALGINATLTALASQPVIVGTVWLSSMYRPGPDGKLTVSGYEDGGHEYCLDELDVENKRVWLRNSWGTTWGRAGRAWMSWADLDKLLQNYGDCTVFVPKTAPPPQPTPVPPASGDEKLAAALRKLLDNRTVPRYLTGPAKDWLKRFDAR